MTTRTLRKTQLPLAIYVRLSRQPKQQKARGSNHVPSIERQIERGKAKARELGRPYVIYNEGVTSAFKGKRPVYDSMVEDLRAGLLFGVIAWDGDRLHRNNRETLDWIDLTAELDFPTHTVTAGYMDLSTSQGRASAIIFGALKRQEVEHRSERVVDELRDKAMRGEFLGGVRPFGFEKDGIKVRTSEADELAKATARVAAGDSLRSILMDWNARGILTTNGKEWTYPALTAVLLRVRNVGWVQYQGKTLDGVKALWPAVVPLDDFLACQKVLSDPKRRTSPGSARVHLLGGMIPCPKCDKKLKSGSVRDRTKKVYPLYRCHVYRSQPKLDFYTELAVLLLLQRKEARKLLTTRQDDAGKLEKEQDRLTTEMNAAAEAVADGRITLTQLEIINKGLQAQLEEVNRRLSDSSRIKVFGGLIGKPDLSDRWKALSLDRKRAVINALFDITVKPVGKGNKGATFLDGVEFRLKNEVRTVFPLADLFTPEGALLEDGPSEDQYREIVRAFS